MDRDLERLVWQRANHCCEYCLGNWTMASKATEFAGFFGSYNTSMRYRLRTLLIVAALLPPLTAYLPRLATSAVLWVTTITIRCPKDSSLAHTSSTATIWDSTEPECEDIE